VSVEPELGADAIVALCLFKSPELYVAQLATLKAGAAFCPIDPNWPEQRQQALLVKSEAKVLLAAGDSICQALEAIMPEHMRLVRLDRLDWNVSKEVSADLAADARPGPAIQSSSLAYKIWTSGTTGLPKAVGIEHRAAVQALRSLQKVIPHDGVDIRYLQFSAYVFDLSILDCFYTWGLGGTLCSASHTLLLGDLVGVANACQASHSLLTPAVMAMTPRESIPSLKVVINGGEKLTQVVADMWSVDCCLLNLYGPAEATLIAMHRRVPAGDSVRAPNIGVALPTVSCHALDDSGSIVPKGAIGQLALGGFQCARGYLGDADKTADKFVNHPRLGRVYLTGDLVRQLADQSFEYLGRDDDQIKINGIRIETLEISAVIKSSHPDIKDSETQAISLDDDQSGQLRIVNFSVLPDTRDASNTFLRVDNDAASAAHALRLAAQKALPSYMVPSLFLIVSRFPRTSSAKIDRAALKSALKDLDIRGWEAAIAGEEGAVNAYGADEDSALSNEAESVIRSFVSELCNIKADQMGRSTPFPSLGLDSIKAMVLARKLTNAGFATSVIDIVEHANVAQLARKISPDGDKPSGDSRTQLGATFLADFDRRHRSAVARELHVEAPVIESISPLTPLQEGMLAETLRDLDQGSYWLNRKYSVASGVDSTVLQQAIKDFVTNTPGCRTTFCSNPVIDLESENLSNHAFVQVVRKDLTANMNVVDLSADDASHDDQLLSAAKSLTGSNPISDKCPLSFVIGRAAAGSTRYLLLRAHHSIYDARSLDLLEEVIAAHLSGQQTRSLPSLMMALPSILSLTSEEETRRRDTWERALEGVPKPPSALAFPELSGQALEGFEAASARFEHVSTTASITWSDLSRTAQDMGTSARPIAQCAWASILAAYLDTDCILLGDSISGRAIGPNMDYVFGPLHATVPVPIVVQAGITRRAMVDQVDDFHKAVLHHQHVSLSFVRRVLAMRPDETLFQSVFVFEPSSGARTYQSVLSDSKDLELSVEHPLAVEVSTDETGNIFLGIVYREDLMSAEQAQVMLAQYDASLASFCSHTDAAPQDWSADAFRNALPASLLSISSPRPSEWIDKATKVSAETWLTETASQHPDRTALEFWSSLEPSAMPEVLSYRALSDRVGKMTAFLTETAPPKSVVAVCLSRCVMTYVSLLAIQQAGLTYLPIDENLPSERQELLANESGAAIVLADDESLSHFETCSAHLHNVHSVDLARYQGHQSQANASPSDLSYVLYTSGSTGKPKGCKIIRSNLSVTIEAFRLTFEAEAPGSFDSGARFLARSAEAFDVALLEVFLPLRTASTIVTGPRSLILEDLRKAMSTMKVTHAAVVPSLFYSEGSRIWPEDLPDLRALIVGGEKIPTDLVEIWGGSKVPTLNAYGPTEATIGNSIARVRPGSSTRNIGRAFPGSQYAIMLETPDGRLEPALRGQAGELCVLGPQVGHGYLGQRESPAFTLYDGQRMYRTGDLARMTVDDEALYLGRMDASQVKIRGARLELSEVDAVLLGSVAGQGLHVATVHLQSKDQLVTFVARVARASALPNGEDALDGSLGDVTKTMWKKARSLPSHMRPAAVVPLTTLPLAVVSGKVDQQALRSVFDRMGSSVDLHCDGSDAADSRPLSKREALIVEELSKLIPTAAKGRATPTPSSDLFVLGLDSLSAVRLSGRLRQRGINVTVSKLLSSVSIEDAAEESHENSEASKGAVSSHSDELTERARQLGLLSADHEGVFHCTPLQESLLAETLSLSGANDEGLAYVSTIEVALADMVDDVRLMDAIDATVAANPMWRTAFAEIDGRLCQLVRSTVNPALWVSESQKLEGRQLVDNLDAIAPVRMQIRRDATSSRRLAILAHHSLYDGVSLDLFLKEIESRYAGTAVPKHRSFSELAQFVNSQDEEASKRCWLSQLEDCVLAPFPSLNPLQVDLSKERNDLLVSSSTSFTQLSELARNMGVTQQALLISAWARLLDQFTGETDSLFGLVLSGRSIDFEDAEYIQGPLITTVPFRTQTQASKGDDPKRRIQAIHRRLLDTYNYQHTSLRKIGQWLQIDAPLFNVLFSFLAPPSESVASSIFPDTTTSMQTEYPLAVEVQPQLDDSIQLRLAYDPHFIPKDQANLLLFQLDDEIRRLVATAAQQSHTESPNLLSLSNPDPYAPSTDDHFLHRFSQQVERRPHAGE
jgi:amino acid adenylation domain-containing protein